MSSPSDTAVVNRKLFQNQFSSREDFRYELIRLEKVVVTVLVLGVSVHSVLVFPLASIDHLCLQVLSLKVGHQNSENMHLIVFTSLLSRRLLVLLVALIVNFNQRVSPGKKNLAYISVLLQWAMLFQAPCLAIGVMVPVLFMDHLVNDIAKVMEWGRPGLIFSGSMFALIFAMVVRFSAVAIGSIESSLSKVSPSLDMASKTMGCNTNQMLRRVHLPLIKRGASDCRLIGVYRINERAKCSIAAASLSISKRFATYVYNYASDEHLELAAMPAVLLVLVGLIPLIIVNRSLEQKH